MLRKRGVVLLLAIVVGAFALAVGVLYQSIVLGGSVARGKEPPGLEVTVAQWLLHRSVPPQTRLLKNPLGTAPDGSVISMGRRLYRQRCETCHGYDGSGKTDIGDGEYPHPGDLRGPDVQNMSDGEVFYHIRNGIRHTGMPGWGMPDEHIWQLVAYLRNLPKVASLQHPTADAGATTARAARYVGSAACKACHEDIYERWNKTRMANVVRDPHAHADAIIPDFSKPDPLLQFARDDIAFVYGSKWKQRYFTKIGDDYFPLPAQWDVTHKVWRPYFVKDGTDWWTAWYPPDNLKRPTGPLCDGCHSVNYNISSKTVTEWNVGCERCHGPGSEHVGQNDRASIVNPARLDYVRANDVCIQCHSQGRPLKNPIAGRYYDWPVGFEVGGKLSDFWQLEDHTLGETSFTHFADGTAHKNRMQGNDFVQSLMYTRGVTCFSCHDVHGTENNALLWKSAKVICLDCHGPNLQNGPRVASLEEHTHHKLDSAGSECVACHMPQIEQTIGDVNVRAHTFRFITPAHSDSLNMPNACNACHKDRTTAWATAALRTWNDQSPWRVAQ